MDNSTDHEIFAPMISGNGTVAGFVHINGTSVKAEGLSASGGTYLCFNVSYT